MTGWWWPGILLAIGLAIGARLAFEGRYKRAFIIFAIFAAIPLLFPIAAKVIPWGVVAVLILLALGITAISKAIFLKDDS